MSTFREALEPFAERAPRPGALEQERPVTITVTAGQLYAARAALSALDAAGGAKLDQYVVIEHSEIDAWIEKNFAGYGRALRRQEDAPLEGEPWMSMAEAKWLTKRAVLELTNKKIQVTTAPLGGWDEETVKAEAERLVDACRMSRAGKKQKSVDYDLDNSRAQCVEMVSRSLVALRPDATGGAGERSEEEQHAVDHARYQVEHATPEKPECCFDYELVADLLRVIDRASPAPVAEVAEYGWLIEHRNSEVSRPHYWTGSGWSYDSLDALRFARQTDGVRAAAGFDEDDPLPDEKPHRVCEHAWDSGQAAPAAHDGGKG